MSYKSYFVDPTFPIQRNVLDFKRFVGIGTDLYQQQNGDKLFYFLVSPIYSYPQSHDALDIELSEQVFETEELAIKEFQKYKTKKIALNPTDYEL